MEETRKGSEEAYKRLNAILSETCRKIEKRNTILAHRLRDAQRLILRTKAEKRLLMKRLDRHGDRYVIEGRPQIKDLHVPEVPTVSATPPFNISILEPAIAALQPAAVSTETTSKSRVNETKGPGCSTAKKTERDPNLPRRPANAFFRFCQQYRHAVHQEHGEELQQGNHELTKILAQRWNELAAGEKKSFYDMYEADRARYEKEMKEYQAVHGVVPKSSPKAKKPRKKAETTPKKTKTKMTAKTEPPFLTSLDDDLAVATPNRLSMLIPSLSPPPPPVSSDVLLNMSDSAAPHFMLASDDDMGLV